MTNMVIRGDFIYLLNIIEKTLKKFNMNFDGQYCYILMKFFNELNCKVKNTDNPQQQYYN
jgi:hypothetical protein